MVNFCKGTVEDFEEIRDFANYIFSQNERPHDFKKLLPKLYDRQQTAEYHYLAKEDDRIKSMVCVEPNEFQILGHNIKAACIGTVSVHPYARGKGYMKSLMHTAIEDMKAKGYAYIYLGGLRQRYEYFGFEPTGIQLNYSVTKTNIRHFNKEIDESKITIIPLNGENEKWLDSAFSLHQEQPIKAVRKRADFITILHSWESKPYIILNAGSFAGYFSLQADGTVSEIHLVDSALYPLVIRPLSDLCLTGNLFFNVAPYEIEKIQFLSQIAESCSVETNHNYLIIDWTAVISAFLNLKAQYEKLADGTLNIAIENLTINITVSSDRIIVSETNQQADIVLSPLNAASFLFSSQGSFMTNIYANMLDKQKLIYLKTWFPLPLFTAPADCC